jgi:hypothetical protein
MKRREIIKGLTLLPFAGSAAASPLNDFAINCCYQQIEGVYGDRSLELIRFDQAVGF